MEKAVFVGQWGPPATFYRVAALYRDNSLYRVTALYRVAGDFTIIRVGWELDFSLFELSSQQEN